MASLYSLCLLLAAATTNLAVVVEGQGQLSTTAPATVAPVASSPVDPGTTTVPTTAPVVAATMAPTVAPGTTEAPAMATAAPVPAMTAVGTTALGVLRGKLDALSPTAVPGGTIAPTRLNVTTLAPTGLKVITVPPPGRNIVRVRFGYFAQARPNHAACAKGWLDLDVPEANTYYQVICYPQSSGNFAVSRLDNLQLDLSTLGSTPWAAAAARGIDAKVVYITEYKGESQGLYVRQDEPGAYKGIKTPLDLENRTVACPFGSTIHFQILFFIDLLGLNSVNLINMSPLEIIAAWDDPERDPPIIDAAGCWGAARDHLLRNPTQQPARTLASAGLLAEWGRPTFGVTAVTRTFANAHPDFMVHVVGILSRITDSFIDRLGQEDPRNIARWDVSQPVGVSYMPSMVDALMVPGETPTSPSKQEIFVQRQALDDFIQYSAAEQLSCRFLGPEPGSCKTQQLATQTLLTAEFLVEQKLLAQLGPLDLLGDENGLECQNAPTFCGSDMFDGYYLQLARRSCVGCLAAGPYAASTLAGARLDSSANGGPDVLLQTLEDFDKLSNRTGFASTEIGRDGGDSTCKESTSTPLKEIQGSFGDGANAERGKSYSDNLNCQWEVRGVDCSAADEECTSIVEVKFERLRVWSGDYVRVYSEPRCELGTRVLLAQLSGFYGEEDDLPIFRAKGCIFVVFETDASQEQVYGDDDGDGILVAYNRVSSGCVDANDCSGQPCVAGLCVCENYASWGADCSETKACLGTTRVILQPGEPELLVSSESALNLSANDDRSERWEALDPTLAYPNDLDCIFEIVLPSDHDLVSVTVLYDLEPSHDLLWLQRGSDNSPGGAESYAVLTGTHSDSSDVYFLPAKNGSASLHLTTDSRGRRRGFSASVRALKAGDSALTPDVCSTPGESGYKCEFQHCIGENTLFPPGDRSISSHVLGSVVSQSVEHGSVPAMPWAPEGGCVWNLLPTQGFPSGVSALRLLFNSPLDLEPHPITSIGDKLVIRTDSNDTVLFVEQCDSDEVCSFDWQTGTCGQKGGCDVRKSVEIAISGTAQASALLVTDRNDGGKVFSGLDFDVVLVQHCLFEEGTHCEEAGGSCIDDHCFCEGGIACSCTCDGDPPDKITTGVKIGIVLAVIVPVFLILFAAFMLYRQRKIKTSREQKSIIETKEAELEEFRSSVVGMCTAIKKYVPERHGTSPGESPSPLLLQECAPVQPHLWCWKETEMCMSQHGAESIVGDPEDCWIRYDSDCNSKIETAFEEQGGGGEFRLNSNYKLNFDAMKQTKVATGFERDLKRVALDVEEPVDLSDVDLSDVEVGDTTALPAELSDEPQMVLVTGDVIQISKKHKDGWAFGSKLYHADEALSRKLVLLAVGADSVDDASILSDTGWFLLEATRLPTADDLAVLQKSVGDTGELAPPDYWDKVVDPTEMQQHQLDRGGNEFQSIASTFLSTLPTTMVKIISIKRIQNLAMWQSYVVKRQTICYRETGSGGTAPNSSDIMKKAVERFERHWLWHGTNTEVMEKIMQQGFNRSFCGKNATVYGKGVYFARDASYSARRTYAAPDFKGNQYILGCRVVVGEYCKGKHDAVTPDLRDASKNKLYDSTVGLLQGDSMSSPSIYVTYHDAQAYPEYLITFRTD